MSGYQLMNMQAKRISEPTCADELVKLLRLAGTPLVELTGSSFPHLMPADAAHALMVASLGMPAHLRHRTMALGISLLHTLDWNGGLGAATQHGDPLAHLLHAQGAIERRAA